MCFAVFLGKIRANLTVFFDFAELREKPKTNKNQNSEKKAKI